MLPFLWATSSLQKKTQWPYKSSPTGEKLPNAITLLTLWLDKLVRLTLVNETALV